jgi:hypothetical protein
MLSRLASVFALAFSLISCSAIPMDYFPSSAMSASGELNIGNFQYLPAVRGEVLRNQIHSTQQLRDAEIVPDVADYFRDAVTTELKFIGLRVRPGAPTLRGSIVELEWAGVSMTGLLVTNYKVMSSEGEVLFDKEISTELPLNMNYNLSEFVAQLIKDNLEQLVSSPKFLQTVN